MKTSFKVWLLICSIATIACEQPVILKLEDLQFEDYEKDMIASEKVDTTFLISHNLVLSHCGSDTLIGFNVYNNDGQSLIEQSNDSWGSTSVTKKYDQLGFLKDITYNNCINVTSHYTYQFLPKQFILKRLFFDGNKQTITDTSTFKFDKKGRLTEIFQNNTNSIFEYNTFGQLIKKKTYSKNRNIITTFFYTANHLDSTLSYDYYLNESDKPYFTKTFYDNSGLRKYTIYQQYFSDFNQERYFKCRNMDEIRLKSRDTVIITYLHKRNETFTRSKNNGI